MVIQNDKLGRIAAYQRNPAVLSANIGSEELALLDASRETYFGLEGPATRIWQLLEKPMTVDEICGIMTQEYDVETKECERDIRAHVAELQARELVVST